MRRLLPVTRVRFSATRRHPPAADWGGPRFVCFFLRACLSFFEIGIEI
jgi:hypothetical protein